MPGTVTFNGCLAATEGSPYSAVLIRLEGETQISPISQVAFEGLLGYVLRGKFQGEAMRSVAYGLSAVAALLAPSAVAQTQTAPPTLRSYVETELLGVVEQCTGLTEFKRQNRVISPIPTQLANSLAEPLTRPYQELDGRTLTDLYSAIWYVPPTGVSPEFGQYRRASTNLGLRFSEGDDRVVYGEANSSRHSHNCSSIVSFAAQAQARIPLPALTAALNASHDDERNLSLSMVTGTFRSPVFDAFTSDTGRRPVSRPNRFAAYAALWQWYAATPNRANQANTYFILDEFDGMAIYRFSGLSWKTHMDASAEGGGALAVISASASARGRLDLSGSTTTTNFSVVRFGSSVPSFKPLPSASDAASGVNATADFVPTGDWSQAAITNRTPIRLVHTIALPTALCDRPAWTPNDAVSRLRVRSINGAAPGEPERCEFSADFTPPAAAPSGGTVEIQYEATLPFPSTDPAGTGRDIKFVIGSGETLADFRSRISLIPESKTLQRVPGSNTFRGQLSYQIRTLPGTTVTGFAPYPDVLIACGEAPAQPIIGDLELVQASSVQAPQLRVRILEARTADFDNLSRSGGTCRLSGSIRANVAGVAQPIAVDLLGQSISVEADPAVVAALADVDRAREAMRVDAVSAQQ